MLQTSPKAIVNSHHFSGQQQPQIGPPKSKNAAARTRNTSSPDAGGEQRPHPCNAEQAMAARSSSRSSTRHQQEQPTSNMTISEQFDDSIRKAVEKAGWLHSIIDIPGSPLGTTSHEVSTQKIQFGTPRTSEEYYYKYYVPRVVSIGPLYYGLNHLAPTENIKLKAVRELLLTTFNKNYPTEMVAIDKVYKSVEKDLLSARDCYGLSQYFGILDSEWCQMMFRDGCFIIYFTTSSRSRQFKIMKKRNIDLVWRDLILLENQLPFQVLNVLACAFKCEEFTISLLYPTLHRMSLLRTRSYYRVVPRQGEAPVPLHLLQYYRDLWFYILFGVDVEEDDNSKEQAKEEDEDYLAVSSPFSVTELKKVGIRCSWTSNLKNLDPKQIHLKSSMLSGKLFLPQLIIDEWTMTLFYNLIAYEYLYSLQDRPFGISSYLSFMSMLINGEEDVKELRARGVVRLNLEVGDDQVIKFFRAITALREPNPQDFKDVKRQISTSKKVDANIYELPMLNLSKGTLVVPGSSLCSLLLFSRLV